MARGTEFLRRTEKGPGLLRGPSKARGGKTASNITADKETGIGTWTYVFAVAHL